MWAGAMAFFDFPQIYADFLMEYFSIQPVQLEYMYSFIYVPNIFLAFGSTLLVNRIGYGLSSIICQLLVLVGMFLCLYGVYIKQYLWLIIGRAVYGIGTEVSYVAQSGITDLWFSGKFLTVAYSLDRSMTYFFASMSTFFLPELFIWQENKA